MTDNVVEPAPRLERSESRRKRRAVRRLLIALVCIAVAVALWIWVFPWIDREFVNNPQIGS